MLYPAQERIGLELENLSFLPFREKLAYSWDRINTAATLCQTKLEGYAGPMLTKLNKKMNNYSSAYKLKMIKDAHVRAFFEYNPGELNSEVTLFRANKYSKLTGLGSENGWERLVKNQLKVVNIDAYHKNILKPPNVSQLAEKIKACLAEVQSK